MDTRERTALNQEHKMSRCSLIKSGVLAGWVIGAILLAVTSSLSMTDKPQAGSMQSSTVAGVNDYAGSDACSACHTDQFKGFSRTSHSRLLKAGWKSEQQGCESCHGPGKAHIDGGGDRTKIRTFENETAKQISDTCLACHDKWEEYNKFRRGEHWRN